MKISKNAMPLLLVAAAACAHAKTEEPKPVAEAPPPAPAIATPEPTPAPPARVPCGSDDQCRSDELCLEGTCTAITASLAACGITRVHFDFDATILRADEYPLLQRAARCIAANQPTHVLIAGNADERGTAQYNVALGYRRATAVRRYLEQVGVSTDRLNVVSYGEEMPLCRDHDEDCWQRNRRAGIRPNETAQNVPSGGMGH